MNHAELITLLRSKGISNLQVLRALTAIPRADFVLPAYSQNAYEDRPLPIGAEQTISQPWIVAFMLQALFESKLPKRVLEIGTGSGYVTALLGFLGIEVYSLERLNTLHEMAKQRLLKFSFYNRLHLILADGTIGYKEGAPYDGIIVSAVATPDVVSGYREQLAANGCMILPLKSSDTEEWLYRYHYEQEKWIEQRLVAVRFVPLVHGETQ